MVSLRHGMGWQPKGEHICEYTHREALVPLLTNKQPPPPTAFHWQHGYLRKI